METTRVYADAMLETVERWVPITHKAFLQYRAGSVSFSSAALEIVRNMLAGKPVSQESSKLSKREWRELMIALGQKE